MCVLLWHPLSSKTIRYSWDNPRNISLYMDVSFDEDFFHVGLPLEIGKGVMVLK